MSKSCWITLYVVVILTVVTVKLDIVIALLCTFLPLCMYSHPICL